MEYPISEILDRYSIAILKKERLDIDNQKEINDLKVVIESYKDEDFEFIESYITKLIDINGKIVFSKIFSDPKLIESVSISTLAKGMYLATLEAGDKKVTKKIVVE
jgi:hypothetical protein